MDEILRRLENVESRLSKIEEMLSTQENTEKHSVDESKKYKGLNGGILLLIDKSYFGSLRSPSEVQKELASNAYYYSINSVDKALRVDFVSNKKLLSRIKENGAWKYAIRK